MTTAEKIELLAQAIERVIAALDTHRSHEYEGCTETDSDLREAARLLREVRAP